MPVLFCLKNRDIFQDLENKKIMQNSYKPRHYSGSQKSIKKLKKIIKSTCKYTLYSVLFICKIKGYKKRYRLSPGKVTPARCSAKHTQCIPA